MAGVKLLSIKLNPESSYFYENEGATLDSNSNEVNVSQRNTEQKMSKKARKAAEKQQRSQKKKESKKREKELKMSSKKKKSPAQDSTAESVHDQTANGDVKGPHFSNDVCQEAKGLNEDESAGQISTANEHDQSKPANGDIQQLHSSNAVSEEEIENQQNEEVNVRLEVSESNATLMNSGPGTSAETTLVSQPLEGSPGAHVTNVVEETVIAQGAHQSEDAPPESTWLLKPRPEINSQGQHVEIEISEVTELENMVEETDSHDSVHVGHNSGTSSPIIVATVHQVESGVDLDNIFDEAFTESEKEETEGKGLKSVRFQEPAEPINEVSDTETGDADNNGEEEKENTHVERMELAEETISKEQASNRRSCEINWHEILESSDEKDTNTSEAVGDEDGNDRAEIEIDRSQIDVYHSDIDVDHPEISADRADSNVNRAEIGIDHEEVENTRSDIEIDRAEINTDRADSNVNRAEIGIDHEEVENTRSDVGNTRTEIEIDRTEIENDVVVGNHREEIEDNDVAPKQHEKVMRKKEKRKRNRLARCCFP